MSLAKTARQSKFMSYLTWSTASHWMINICKLHEKNYRLSSILWSWSEYIKWRKQICDEDKKTTKTIKCIPNIQIKALESILKMENNINREMAFSITAYIDDTYVYWTWVRVHFEFCECDGFSSESIRWYGAICRWHLSTYAIYRIVYRMRTPYTDTSKSNNIRHVCSRRLR